MKYNQELIYPKHCLEPQEITQRLELFEKDLKTLTDMYEKNSTTKNAKNILFDNIQDSLEKHILPDNVKLTGKLNKSGIGKLVDLYDKALNDIDFMWNIHLLMRAGFILSSIFPVSFQPEALIIPDEFLSLKDEAIKKYNQSEKAMPDAIKFQDEMTKVAEKVKTYFEENDINVVDMMNSKAKGNVSHIQSLLLSVGLSIDSFGKINDVIDRSHSEGMTQTQFFNNSSQAIQALYAKSSETAKPGYLGRMLSAIGSNIKLSTIKDCSTEKLLTIKIKTIEVLQSLIGRQYRTSKFGGLKTVHKESDLVGKTIHLRSALYCTAKDGICNTCYNQMYIDKMQLTAGANIGLLASTGLTEDLVSLTLKKSHVGVTLDQEELDLEKELRAMY